MNCKNEQQNPECYYTAKVLLFVNSDFHWGGYFFNDRYLTLQKEIQKNITERHAVNYDNKKK